ncbi:malto-oligosyltrehalose trehalohydrolase [Amnibacterium sp. CER49]|uniref:malto-oligosyltrehalose trehalohydrolase n=1 Tax=Amnibacterium sp. CER49 TaxID=3039161 RepID=UPI00244C2EC4|nr:malto-oligosyltrehalose trehalohydrolase [Amnibacterium sp. CER49]MDH2442667.1 malto-oligosyltrehalose trehalohydrolase [Amnibacterium sp. CER49]
MTDTTTIRHPLAVWAPKPERVRVRVQGREHELVRGDDGWWSPREGELTDVAPDAEYGYLLGDDDRLLPDPRSRRQPRGVHEASQRFDPGAHEWQDAAWTGRQLAGGSIYELHIGTFTPAGTLDSAIERLDHLVDLGVTHVEVLPVNAFNGTHNWGYDGVLWYAVQETYGGPAAYQRFVDACHRRGLAVIQDVVYNHLGPSGNYLPQYGPYLAELGGNTWGSSVNLDGPESDEVRRYIIDNALMWLNEYHVDGLRLDAVHALVDHRAQHLLEQLAVEVAVLSAHVGRPLPLIAESDMNDPRLITSREAHGYGLDAQWSDDFHHALHVALTGETTGYYEDFAGLDALAKVLQRGFFHDGTMSTFRERHHGRPIDLLTLPTHRLVTFLQDHDQIGNRATGDRISATLSPARLAIGAVLNLTTPFTPMLFMGEEWGASTPWQFFTSHPEPELGEATAKGRIAEFAKMGWDPAVVPDPQDPETFTRSKLDWDEVGAGPHGALLDLHRRLLDLRRRLPELTDPRFLETRVLVDAAAQWLVLRRGPVTVGVNLGDAETRVAVPGALVLSTAQGVSADGTTLVLPPESAAIVVA